MQTNTSSCKIRFISSWDINEIVELYKIGGWWKKSYDASHLPNLIKHSFAFAIVYDPHKEKAVGMGRVISDGVSDAYIQDFVIHPDYRKQGLGKILLDQLIKYCHSRQITWIALIAEPNSRIFYQKNGFIKMKNHTPMKHHPEG